MTLPEDRLNALALACEMASGPDRKIDGEIDRLFNKRPAHGDFDASESAFWRVGESNGLLIRGDGYARDSFCAASYTGSLDAARMIVPEGCTWSVGDWSAKDQAASATVWPVLKGSFGVDYSGIVKAATPALALTAAALRALALKSGEG